MFPGGMKMKTNAVYVLFLRKKTQKTKTVFQESDKKHLIAIFIFIIYTIILGGSEAKSKSIVTSYNNNKCCNTVTLIYVRTTINVA